MFLERHQILRETDIRTGSEELQCTLDSLIDDTLVINDTHAKCPKKIKRHPCNKRHSGHLNEKLIKDTQSIKRHSEHSRESRGVVYCESL